MDNAYLSFYALVMSNLKNGLPIGGMTSKSYVTLSHVKAKRISKNLAEIPVLIYSFNKYFHVCLIYARLQFRK